jgi:nicotinamidase-related amidase
MIPQLGGFTEEMVLRKARRQYEEGRARIDIRPSGAALLVVDMLDEFVRPGWSPCWVPDATRQAPRIRGLQDACRRLAVPVIAIGYDPSIRGLGWPTSSGLLPNAQDDRDFAGQLFDRTRFYPEVAPVEGDLVLLKYMYSAFRSTPLETILRNLGRDTVIICGTMTNYCCGATAREAYAHGFKVVFGSDVNSTDDEECQRAELKTLRRGFARVASSEEIIEELQANARSS